MAKEICISSTPHETRLAILEDDQLAEIYYERENEYTLAGSIYNGRVTRVLPGMQSAFVDLGLERDAFLYVTDFLELEDQEESDEIEKAAVSGGNQAPREVRHGGEQQREGDRGERSRRDRGGRDRDREQGRGRERGEQQRQVPEPGIEVEPVETVIQAPAEAADADTGEDMDESGAKRWRGRRRRRGGRGGAQPVPDPIETEASAETYLDPSVQPDLDVSGEFQTPRPEPSHREQTVQRERPAAQPEPASFVLPGESLSKYGGTPAASAPKPEAPARPVSRSKPSTMVESPLSWDGSGLLPGESLARHRQPAAESAQVEVDGEPQGIFSDAPAAHTLEIEETEEFNPETDSIESVYVTPEEQPLQAHELVEEELVEEDQPLENLPGAPEEVAFVANETDPFADPFFTADPRAEGQTEEHATTVSEEEARTAAVEESAHEIPAEAASGTEEQSEHEEKDRSASHHVDPLPPSEFRLFGLGGKKKKDDAPEYPSAVAVPAGDEPQKTRTASASSYSPGTGLVEEETIEEEEFDAPGHAHHRHEEGDLEDYEEEEKHHTSTIRSGELGEMLQEAHLDHKIQLRFDDKNGGEEDEDIAVEDEDEVDEGDEQQAAAEGAPAPSRDRRDRNGRGRRGQRGTGDRGERGNRRGGPSRRSAQTSDLPIISDLLKPGQEILVQIAKEPIAKKGARITSHIALPGRFLVFMPTVSHVGVSRKIASDEERQRLKRILISERGETGGGFIVRTAAEGASEEELRADLRFLIHLWEEIKERSEKSKSPALIYHDLSLIERILRDQVSENFSAIWVDSQDDYERIVRFLNRFAPNMVRRVKLYTKETPLFEHFGIQDEISKALRSKVWLKSGGSIVINQTEALVAIDINTGKYVGKTARLEDTIVKTNLDAIPEIVRQIRLRDLGGIIVIDFIDMDERKNRFKVLAALEEALKADRAPTKVLQFNDFGLVAITRKRVKQSLERTLSVPCPTCQATGMVKSPSTVANEIYIELRKMRRHFENPDVLVRVHPETVKVLKANNARWLTDFEDLTGKNILVKSDATLHPEQFDIQG
ncbi:Rne/Rng family ribonuclease [Occallatibacter riparius]|uniref:Rne/Rng family ribonuclease n=1 Tax=Occallatibacter riparius TaxID=1002689 RepID=A0A9J7BUL2_9BACT|nr:Rne/Rng family ribonuclease [Occallatibacter riparius]UWZ86320.1 Rne/Rng family ribonuclease [Occallatibacter riparius]